MITRKPRIIGRREFPEGRRCECQLTVKRMICVVLPLATIFATVGAFAEPNKEQYELSERCGKLATESFKDDYAGGGVSNTKYGQELLSYENHYSATLNKCFFLEIVTSYNYKQVPKNVSTMMTLFDLNDHKAYGTFFKRSIDNTPFECTVQKTVCHSESEWQELLKPYMEE